MKRQIGVLTASLLILSGCGTSQTASGDPGAIFAGAAIGGNVGGAIGGLIGDNNGGWRGGYRVRPSVQLSEPLPEQPLEMLCLPQNKRHTVTG